MANSNIEIRKVEGLKGIKEFIDFRIDLYKDSEYAVPFLYQDEVDTLNPEKNNSFKFCEAEYFMAYRDGKPVGRVAAIINRKANETWNRKNVRFGWFDFVDDVEVSRALLDKVSEWGKERGMTHIVGPLGFTDMDREGMMVKGFDKLGTMSSSYNYDYYMKHIEAIGGYEKDNDWIMLHINVPDGMPEKFGRTAAMIEKRYNLHAIKPTRKLLIKQGGAQKLFEILNICYSHLYEFSQLSQDQIDDYVNNYIKIADMNLISLIVDGNFPNTDCPEGKIIGFGVTFPSFSDALRKSKNGKLFPFGWYHLAKTLLFHKTDCLDLYLIGVLPEYRSKGANALIFRQIIEVGLKYGFKRAEALPMMETNNKVLDQWQYLDATEHKRLRTFRKEI